MPKAFRTLSQETAQTATHGPAPAGWLVSQA